MQQLYRLLIAASIALWFVDSCLGQNRSAFSDAEVVARIDTIFAEHAHPDTPGCAVGVSLSGEPIFTKGYGRASLEHDLPITPSTTFNLGSVSKHFSAMALLLLEQRGMVSLDDNVRKLVPELPDYGSPMRVRDLLYHTSGLRDYGTLEKLAGTHLRTNGQFLDLISRQRGLNFLPGSRHEYSHSDYELLGIVIERVTGEPLGVFLEREIWAPLGMTSTRLHDDRGQPIPGRAFAHAMTDHGHRIRFPGSCLTGGSNVYSSVEDLLRWERNFYTATVGGPEIIDRMLSRPTLASGLKIPYAFGLMHNEYRGLRIVQRSGGGGGFSSEMMRFPDHGLTVFTLSNSSPSHPKHLSRAVAEIFLGEQMQGPRDGAPVAVTLAPREELEHYPGVYQPIDDPWDMVQIIERDGKLCEVYGGKIYELMRGTDGVYRLGGLTFAFTPSTDGGPVRLTLSLVS